MEVPTELDIKEMLRRTDRRNDRRRNLREEDNEFRSRLMSSHNCSRTCGCDGNQGEERWVQP
eukprot:9303613-Karenia_brevis.AAC.1